MNDTATVLQESPVFTGDILKAELMRYISQSERFAGQTRYSAELRDFILDFSDSIGAFIESRLGNIQTNERPLLEKAQNVLERLCDVYHSTYYER